MHGTCVYMLLCQEVTVPLMAGMTRKMNQLWLRHHIQPPWVER
jgi:hypothetical protein